MAPILHNGTWLPDGETHLQRMISERPLVNGKAQYQWHKYQEGLKLTELRRNALDIGAHVGLWSAHMVDDFEYVYAFEPISRYRELYERNVKGDNHTLYPYACADKEGEIHFAHQEGFSGNTHVDPDGEEAAWSVAIDSYAFSDIDFMKVDCEGYELYVLKGAKDTILRNRPVIMVEQKRDFAKKRYGLGEKEAVAWLISLGMEKVWHSNGDYVMVWPESS